MKRATALATTTIALISLFGQPALAQRGPRLEFLEDGFIELHGFIQPRFDSWLDAPDGKEARLADFSIKRTKLIFKGQIWKRLGFFITPVVLGLGTNGDHTPTVDLSDAWLEYRFGKWLKINAGLLKLPFGRQMQVSGGKLHGLDFHGFYLNRVVGDPARRVIPHRDIGVMVRGILFGTQLDYRVAVVDGKESGGDRDAPRVTGRVGLNILDDEPGYMWSGSYLGKKKILSFGVSFDLQPGVAGPDGDDPFWALAVDAHADIPLGQHGLVATAAWHYFGPPVKLDETAVQKATPEGMGLWAEVGFRLFGHYEPLVAVQWYEPREGVKGERLAILGGFNWWIRGHTFNLKAQVGATRLNGADDWTHVATLQGQLFF